MYNFTIAELNALHECGSLDLTETLAALYRKAITGGNPKTFDMLQFLTGKLIVLGLVGCYASFYLGYEAGCKQLMSILPENLYPLP